MAGERILVTDDEELIVQLCRRILVKRGFEVETASSGDRALQMCEENRFDLLLTDIKMPGIDGLELIERVKKIQPEITAMVITGHGTVDTAIESLKLGVMGFIVKPFTPDALLVSVQNVIEKSQAIRENIRLRSLMPLFDITKSLMSEVDLDALLNLVLGHAIKETRAEEGTLTILGPGGEPATRVKSGYAPNMAGILEGRIGDRLVRWCAEHGRPVHLRRRTEGEAEDPISQELRKNGLFEHDDLSCVLSVPLFKNDRVIGVLNLSKLTDPAPFSESDQEFITILCGQAAVLIENARLFTQVHSSSADHAEIVYDRVRAVIRALQGGHQSTQEHADRLINYAVAVGRKLALAPDAIQALKYAASLHDIGSLNDPARAEGADAEELTIRDDDWQDHPTRAAEVVRRIGFLREVAPILLHHHERWDGKGFPAQVSGEAIPIGSRIMAVIHAFHGMTSERPGHSVRSFQGAISELRRGEGSLYDPRVVGAFLEVLEGKAAKAA